MKPPLPPESYNFNSAARRRGRDRELSFPAPPDYPEQADPPLRPLALQPRGHWQLWALFVVLCSLTLAVLGPVLLGLYVGGQERAGYLHERAVDHYKQALAYESENYGELALAELQIAVKFDPNYQEAVEKLQTLEATPATKGTPVSESAAIADQLFQRAQSAIGRQQWSDAIDSLEELRRADAGYRADQVRSLLAQAYLKGGQQSVAAGDIEQARARFEAGLALDGSNAQMKTLRDRAVLYLKGKEAVGHDWQAAAYNFQQLYQQDEKFYDVKEQFLNALIEFGDTAARQGAFCIAQREFEQAVRLGAGDDVQTKLEDATWSCKQIVTAPTPTPTPEGGGELANAGAFTVQSRVDMSAPCEGTGSVGGSVRDAAGNPLSNLSIRIYNDYDYHPSPFALDEAGGYSIMLGNDPGTFHLVLIDGAGQPVSGVYSFDYAGGQSGCHVVVDWIRNQ